MVLGKGSHAHMWNGTSPPGSLGNLRTPVGITGTLGVRDLRGLGPTRGQFGPVVLGRES